MTPTTAEPSGFETEAVMALTTLQRALLDVIGRLPGPYLRRPSELQTRLGVHRKLAWQVHKFAHARYPLEEAANLPTVTGVTRVIDAARREGTPDDAARAAEAALQNLERVAKRYAGARADFDSMLAGLATGQTSQIDFNHRRAAFKANSHIWGLQGRTTLSVFGLQSNREDPALTDFFSIGGIIDLRRFRSNVPWMMMDARVRDDQGEVRQPHGRRLIDEEGGASSNPAGLIRPFCTVPALNVTQARSERGRTVLEIQADGVGNETVLTTMRGHVCEGELPRYAVGDDRTGHFAANIRTPAEVLILDLLVHEDLYEHIEPTARVLSDHRGADRASRDLDRDLLCELEPPEYLGMGPSVLHTPDVPRYAELARYVFDRVGWESRRFKVFRTRLAYPVMPSSAVVQFELPERA